MAQESPTTLLYAQAIQAINRLRALYAAVTSNKGPEDISESINNTLSKFVLNAGKTTTQYEPLYKSEVPTSEKMNRFLDDYQGDVNLLQNELDLLRASTVLTHNLVKTDILKAQQENNRLQNKIKTLKLYSSIDNSSLVYFGDSFITEDFIDWSLVSASERAELLGSGYLSLPVSKQQNLMSSSRTSLTILKTSNGFIGNNQEIQDPSTTTTNPINGQKMFSFVSATNRGGLISSIVDGRPNTWFEFEKYLVSNIDRSRAQNLNFEYQLTNDSTNSYLISDDNPSRSVGSLINWADGIPDDVTSKRSTTGVLKLHMEIDLGAVQQVNVINLVPYGLIDNKNNPFHVRKVYTSINKTDWNVVGPENVYISTSIDNRANFDAETILVGSAVWVTDGSQVRYIRFEIEQRSPIVCYIGHNYYVDRSGPAINTPNYLVEYPVLNSANVTYDSAIPYNSPIYYGGTDTDPNVANSGYDNYATNNNPPRSLTVSQTSPIADAGYRKAGPNPPVNNPQLYNDARNTIVNDLMQKREYFTGKRWAIGIRDIGAKKNTYDKSGVVVSKKFNVPGIVDRVSLEADISIPDSYDRSVSWVSFYISPDDGLSWYQISRIQDDFLGIPEVLAFNDPTPFDLRESGVAYYDVRGTVDSIRLKINIDRPTGSENSTPIVHSYKLKVIRRDQNK